MAGGINPFVYVQNNPTNHTDSFGLFIDGGIISGPSAYIVGSAIAAGILYYTAPIVADIGQSIGAWLNEKRKKSKPGSKPNNCPTGTKPIDQSGLSKDDIHNIKDGVGAGAKDWTGITPDGDVITGDENGDAFNNGPYGDYLPHNQRPF